MLLSGTCFSKDLYTNRRGYVIQALENGALGYICPKWSLTADDCYSGKFVYFDFNDNFVDNQLFHLPKNLYLQENGIYRYTNKDNVIKTVRKVQLISK